MITFAVAPVAAIGLVAGFLMLMVALGLTGVLWQSVTQRTQEIGLRRAKGAERVQVQRQILAELVVMTSMAVLVAAVLVAQVPLISPFYWIEPHVYVVGFLAATATIYAADAPLRLVPEPAGDTRRAGGGVRGTNRGRLSEGWPCCLIVDDDPSVTASLALLLKQAGYAVARRRGPAEALAWLERETCDLVIQDMNFSRQTTGDEGLALLGRIKALRPSVARRPDHRVGLDRARGRGHEGRRLRLRHQALEQPADAPDRPDRPRPGGERAGGRRRGRAVARGARRAVRLRRARRRGSAPAPHPAAGRPRRPHRRGRPDHRRERHRQGARRRGDAPEQPPRARARSSR